MASAILGAMAGACALIAAAATLASVLALMVAFLVRRANLAPALGCGFSGLTWGLWAVALQWMSSALAGQ